MKKISSHKKHEHKKDAKKHHKVADHHEKKAAHHRKKAKDHEAMHHAESKKKSVRKINKKKHHEPVNKKAVNKFKKVMHEFKEGSLHAGSKKGPKVMNPKQAVAIAYSEDRRLRKQHGQKIK